MLQPGHVFIFLYACLVQKGMDSKGKTTGNEDLRKWARDFMRDNKVVFDRLAKL